MALNADKVSHSLIEFDRSNFEDSIELEKCEVSVSSSYLPEKNRQTFEIVLPRLKNQMSDESFEYLKSRDVNKTYHDIKYNAVPNIEFYKFLRTKKYDKIRFFDEKSRVYVTYYYSKTIPLRLMDYDYEAALLIYSLFPKRYLLRIAPCTKLVGYPDTIELMKKFLKDPCESFLSYKNKSDNATIEKYFFKKSGKPHGILIAYTLDKKFEFDWNAGKIDSEYNIIDFDNRYFKEGSLNIDSWKSSIVKKRLSLNEEFYETFEAKNLDVPNSFISYEGKILSIRKSKPKDMIDKINNFIKMYQYDMRMLTDRSTWNKYQFNNFVKNISDYYCPIHLKGNKIIDSSGKIIDEKIVSPSSKDAMTKFEFVKGLDGLPKSGATYYEPMPS